MGRAQRPRPAYLALKLRQLRDRLGYTQHQMYEALQDEKTPTLYENHINLFESGRREPDLLLLLRYARVAGLPVEVLIDDEQDLPKDLPAGTTVWVMKGGHLKQQRRSE